MVRLLGNNLSNKKKIYIALTCIYGIGLATSKKILNQLNIDPNIESNMSKQAINDANRKANSIAKEVGKKIGKILNIEDKTTSCCSDFGEVDQEIISRKYTLNITFELVD